MAQAPLGATVTIHIPEAHTTSQNMLQVPIGAIFDAGKGPGVWAIEGSPTHVSWHAVKILGLDDSYARVDSDLKKGAMIVTLGANLLHDGENVRVLDNTSTAFYDESAIHISAADISVAGKSESAAHVNGAAK